MKKVNLLLWPASILAFSYFALSMGPDFSGSWTLVRTDGIAYGKSFGGVATNSDSRIAITHLGDRILVQSQCAKCGYDVREYVTDGMVRNLPNKYNASISYSARWQEDELILHFGVGGDSPFGQANVTSHQVWSLSDNKQQLTISSKDHNSVGEVNMNAVYKRAE